MSGSSSTGMSFTGTLTLIFIVLKLVGVIDWSWVWVLCPIWIGIIVFFVVFLFYFIKELIDYHF